MREDINERSAIEAALEKCAARVLLDAGYGAAEARALKHLSNVLLRYMVHTCGLLRKQSETAGRSAPTLVDSVVIMKKIREIPENYHRIELEESEIEEKREYASEICTYIDYPANYYEFLPRLPPAHTYKNTSIKRRISDDKAQKAKIRSEHATKIVDSFFELMKKSNKKLSYANYLRS